MNSRSETTLCKIGGPFRISSIESFSLHPLRNARRRSNEHIRIASSAAVCRQCIGDQVLVLQMTGVMHRVVPPPCEPTEPKSHSLASDDCTIPFRGNTSGHIKSTNRKIHRCDKKMITPLPFHPSLYVAAKVDATHCSCPGRFLYKLRSTDPREKFQELTSRSCGSRKTPVVAPRPLGSL